jgi:hypothetical protein
MIRLWNCHIYHIIVPFQPFALIVECVLASMFKDKILNVDVFKCVLLRCNVWVVLKLTSKKQSFLCKGKDLVLRK